MSLKSYFNHFSKYFYEYFLGLNVAKISRLQNEIENSGTELIGDSSLVDDYKSVESYYVDKRKSNQINTDVLQKLLDELLRCIEVQTDFEINFELMSRYPREARFFHRIYNRKFDEISELFLKINPFPMKSKKFMGWNLSKMLTNKPPIFPEYNKLYRLWKITTMTLSHNYLNDALKRDLKYKAQNKSFLPNFTYCQKNQNELKKRVLLNTARRTIIALGVLFGFSLFMLKKKTHQTELPLSKVAQTVSKA